MRTAHEDAIALMQLASVAENGYSATTLGDDLGRPAGPAEISNWIEQVAASKHIASPVKMVLLGHLHHRSVAGVEPLAGSLVSSDGRRAVHTNNLLKSIDDTMARRELSGHMVDPLGRSPHELSNDGSGSADRNRAQLLENLLPAVAQTMLSVRPMCQALGVDDHGKRVQYVETEYFSSQPLDSFATMVDPRCWPKRELMSLIFKGMDEIEGQGERQLDAPDSGWERVLRETVDLSMFSIPEPVTTDLLIRMMRGKNFIGSTFEMARSVDGQLTHDQGYLLAEDLVDVPAVQARRFLTMKSFRFANPIDNLPVDLICPLWSRAASLVMHACTGLAHEEPV